MVILQFNSILITTTTILLLLIYDYNPPKRFAKFEINFLAGITANTLQAGIKQVPILNFHLGLGPTLANPAALELPLTSLHPLINLPSTGARPT